MSPALDLLVPVGPGEREPERAREAIESVLHYESQVGAIMLVDDHPGERDLVAACGLSSAQAVSLPNPRDGRGEGTFGTTCAATLTGLAWLAANGRSPLVLRLDADALAIAPFVAAVAERLREEADVGLIGSYDFAPTRMPREFGVWASTLRSLRRPVWVNRRPPNGFGHIQVAFGRTRAAAVRRQLSAARAAGYRDGEHCLGAACVLTRELIERLERAGYLRDPLTWLGTWVPDDVMLGIQTRAVGLRLAGMTDDGEPFGIAQLQLPGPPEWLVAQGYSLIHPVKDRDGAEAREAAVREFFRRRRSAVA